MSTTCAYPSCHEIGTKACSNCRIARYCSKEHQKIDWKFHKKICGLATGNTIPLPSSGPIEDKDLCYRQLSLEEEFVRATDSFRVLSDFYFDVDKNRRRDRVSEIQNYARQLEGIVDPNAINKLKDELKRQYLEYLTVEPNDSGPSLMHKKIIFDVVAGLLQQLNVPMLSPAILGSKKETIDKHIKDKIKRMTALTEAIRLKYHPQSSVMSGSQMDMIRRQVLTKWAKSKRTTGPPTGGKVPEMKCPWYAGPPGWIFPTGYASFCDKSPDFRMMCSLMFTQRIADHKHRFYVYNYPAGHYSLMGGPDATPLTFEEHRRYHTLAGAAVVVSAEAEAILASTKDRLMSVQQFGAIGNIDESLVEMYTQTCGTMEAVKKSNAAGGSGVAVCLPHVVVGSCDCCGQPAVGECVCGECYCSVRL